MRITTVTAAGTLALAAAGSAIAAPASVTVTIAPELQAKAERVLGVREVDDLAAELKASVTRQAAKSGRFDDARIMLELTDARPNRPTFKQLSDRPGLSYESFGTGGVRIEGHAVLASGQVIPLSYNYFESDIRWARLGGTWADAEAAIDRFAYRLGRSQTVAER